MNPLEELAGLYFASPAELARAAVESRLIRSGDCSDPTSAITAAPMDLSQTYERMLRGDTENQGGRTQNQNDLKAEMIVEKNI